MHEYADGGWMTGMVLSPPARGGAGGGHRGTGRDDGPAAGRGSMRGVQGARPGTR
ncbi:MAG: hypothetical protein JW900_13095 [Anaerolineae bacterium]|nr:hypothetical protein [Anaerolineae bacterium]